MNYDMDVDELLVLLMKNHPNLYNKHDEYYKDNQHKRNSWAAIAKEVNLDADTVKRRWENLRDRFVRAYREHSDFPPLKGSSGGKNRFKLFEQMLWLTPHIRKRKITSTIPGLRGKPCTLFTSTEDTQSSETHESVKIETHSVSSDLTYNESYVDDEALLSSTSKPVLPAAVPQTDESLDKSDHYFMMSVMHDCQNLPPRKKIKFKRDVLQLLEKYMFGD